MSPLFLLYIIATLPLSSLQLISNMGNIDGKGISPIQKLYTHFKAIHPYNNEFHECQILQHKRDPHQRVILREINVTDDQQFKTLIQRYEVRQKISHPNVLNLTNHFYNFEQQLCGQFYKIFLLFEYPQSNLQLLPAQSEAQLLDFLKQCIEGLAHLQQNDIEHSTIQLKNLYLIDNQVKITDPQYFSHRTNFIQIIQNPNTPEYIYLSPLLVKAIQLNNWQPKHNPFKSDVYSLGMSFLHLALNQTNSDCYQYEQGIIFEDKIQIKLNKLKQKYHATEFTELLALMIQSKEDLRPDFIQLTQPRGRAQTTHTTQRQQQDYPYLKTTTTQRNTFFDQPPMQVPPQLTPLQPVVQQQKTMQPAIPINKIHQRVVQIPPMEYVHQYTIKTDASSRSLTPVNATKVIMGQQPNANVNSRDTTMIRDVSCPKYRDSRHSSKDAINVTNNSYLHTDTSINTTKSPYFPPKPKMSIPSGQTPIQIQQILQQHFVQQKPTYTQQQQTPQSQKLYNLLQKQIPSQLVQSTYQQQSQSSTSSQTLTVQAVSPPVQQATALPPAGCSPLQADVADVLPKSQLIEHPAKQSLNDENSDLQTDSDAIEVKYSNILSDSTNLQHNNQTSNFFQSNNKEFSLPFDLPHFSKGEKGQILQNTNNSQFTVPGIIKGQQGEFVVEHYQNGSRYEGLKLNGMRHGQGKFYYADGGLYDGEWKENKMHGEGTLYYLTGQYAYQGSWYEDQFQGHGTLYNERPIQLSEPFDYKDFDYVEDYWIKYSGNFDQDNKEGQGTLYLTNGERFVGTFQKDFINGAGIFYCMNGKIIDGRWCNNKLIQ